MGQVNVNSGGPASSDGAGAAAAGINLLIVVIVIAAVVAIGVIGYGAFAGGWFGGSSPSGGNINVTVQPQLQVPAASNSAVPAASK